MDEVMREYGGLLLSVSAGAAIIGILAKLVFSGGMLSDLLIKLGNMAC